MQKGEFFRFFIVNIRTRKYLKSRHDNFSIIFKNVEILFEDISPCMWILSEEGGYLKTLRKYLINSYFGKEVLIDTNKANFYLEMELRIIKIYEFIVQ